MTDYGTIRIPRDEFERHNERRKDMNCSWVEYLDGESPQPLDTQHLVNEIAATADKSGRVDSDDLAREVVSKLDYAELANAVASELETRMR